MSEFPTQVEVLNWAFSILKSNNREENVAPILLQHHLGCTRTEYYLNMREEIDPNIVKSFKKDIKKHVETGVPVQHLLGYEYFYGDKFTVNQHTLIPRPETEELVDLMIKTYPKDANFTIVDLGTGSGVIAITLAKHFKNALIYATDISKEALKVAKDNALSHGVTIQFYEGDFLEPIIDRKIKIDLLISNPPYIDYADLPSLSDTVKEFDPHQALFATNKGLGAYELIMKQVLKLPSHPQTIYFEIGYKQADDISHLFKEILPKYQVITEKDINNKDRILIGQYQEVS